MCRNEEQNIDWSPFHSKAFLLLQWSPGSEVTPHIHHRQNGAGAMPCQLHSQKAHWNMHHASVVKSWWTCSFSRIQIRINDPRLLRSWCIKATDESLSRKDWSVLLMHHNLSNLGNIDMKSGGQMISALDYRWRYNCLRSGWFVIKLAQDRSWFSWPVPSCSEGG